MGVFFLSFFFFFLFFLNDHPLQMLSLQGVGYGPDVQMFVVPKDLTLMETLLIHPTLDNMLDVGVESLLDVLHAQET